MRYAIEDKARALKQLRAWLKPGDTVFTIVRHVSRSGMSRSISVFASIDGQPQDITYQASRVIGESVDQKHGGIRMRGCGMDMGFALVYSLSHVLYPDGHGCIGEHCPSNDHNNGDLDYTPHPGCGKPDARGHRDHWHASGAHALRHRWM